MKRLSVLAALGLLALPSAFAQRGPGLAGASVVDVLDRRARMLDDSLGLDDAQETRLRALFADRLDTLAARAPRPQGRRMDAPARPDGDRAPAGFEGRPRAGRGRPFRPGDADTRFEPLFVAIDADVRALLTPEQAVRYDAFRSREAVRAEAFRAARQEGAPRSGRAPRNAP